MQHDMAFDALSELYICYPILGLTLITCSIFPKKINYSDKKSSLLALSSSHCIFGASRTPAKIINGFCCLHKRIGTQRRKCQSKEEAKLARSVGVIAAF